MAKQAQSAKNLERRRYLVLAAACLAAGLTGIAYMWSIFTTPLMQAHGWNASQVSLAYSLYYVVDFAVGIVAGALQRRMGTRPLTIVGGVLLSLGWLCMSQVDTVALLYLSFSVIGGAGAGFVYNASVSTATKWFPDKKGFANGLCIGMTGLMPIVFAPLGNYLVQAFDLSSALMVVGAIPLVLYLAFAWLVNTPPDGWAPAGWNAQVADVKAPGSVASGEENAIGAAAVAGSVNVADVKASGTVAAPATGRDYSSREMLRTSRFWMMFVTFTAAASSGAMITSQASLIGAELVGLTAAQGAIMVALLALGNFAGRFGLGSLSDRIGRYNTLLVSLAITALDMLVVFPMAGDFVSFAVAIMLAGACYGGVMTVMPSLCGDLFGMRNFGQNYAILFGGFAMANLVGPMIAASMFDATGSYSGALMAAAALAACGIAIVLVMRRSALRVSATQKLASASADAMANS